MFYGVGRYVLVKKELVHTGDYTIYVTNLKEFNSVRDLGVITNSTLSPHDHLEHISPRASSRLGFIGRSGRCFTPPQMLPSSVVQDTGAHQNIDGLQTKIDRLTHFLHDLKPDLIIVTEYGLRIEKNSRIPDYSDTSLQVALLKHRKGGVTKS